MPLCSMLIHLQLREYSLVEPLCWVDENRCVPLAKPSCKMFYTEHIRFACVSDGLVLLPPPPSRLPTHLTCACIFECKSSIENTLLTLYCRRKKGNLFVDTGASHKSESSRDFEWVCFDINEMSLILTFYDFNEYL